MSQAELNELKGFKEEKEWRNRAIPDAYSGSMLRQS